MVLGHIKLLYPEAPIFGLGVSYGGIILGTYLVEKENSAIGSLDAVMFISTPFDPYPGNFDK